MSDTNVCTFIGRVTRDAELTTVGAKNTSLVKWGIANNTGFGQYEKTNFFNCQMWQNIFYKSDSAGGKTDFLEKAFLVFPKRFAIKKLVGIIFNCIRKKLSCNHTVSNSRAFYCIGHKCTVTNCGITVCNKTA